MSYLLYGSTLTLAWFLTANLGLSLIVACVGSSIARRATGVNARRRASILLGVRLLPACVSALFALGVFLPSFFSFEPRDFHEGFGVVTTLFAAVASGLILTALLRGRAALRETSVKSNLWLKRARRMAVVGSPAPVFCLDTRTPAMTLVGVFRPKLLLTLGTFHVLTPAELRASMAHEKAHRDSRDNLKRLLMRAMPDPLTLTRRGHILESEWARATEQAADDRAGTDPATRLSLASALLKFAAATSAPPPGMFIASPLVGPDRLAARIDRLVADVGERPASSLARATSLAVTFAMIGAAATLCYPGLLAKVHQLSEVIVRLLP